CFQNCRRSYTVRDTETGTEFNIDNRYVMSPRDLCTLEFFDRILESGVSVLKIEGRGRSADYVAHVVRVYRAALDQWLRGEPLRPEQLAKWEEELASVFNRGFWKGGYYLGNRLGEWAACGDSQATVRKEFVGRIVNYYKKPEVAELLMTSGELVPGDRILVTGDTTGAQELKVDEFLLDGVAVNPAKKGMDVTFLCPLRLRTNDKVYKLMERNRS
ncbi:MAG: U32 family peptidase, partial [bacterium]|nr:U32 family peptidase [bacterium]